ncbi:hypothetical protein SLA2020_407460 [Shorea laevis]
MVVLLGSLLQVPVPCQCCWLHIHGEWGLAACAARRLALVYTFLSLSSASSAVVGKLSHSSSKSFVPNPHSLQQFLTKQCKSGAITLDEALHFFDYMIRMLPLPPASSFNHLLGALAKIQCHDHLISFYQRLNSVGVFPDIRTLNILLNCCCKMGLASDGFLVLGKILRGGYTPTSATFSTLIKGLCGQQDWRSNKGV